MSRCLPEVTQLIRDNIRDRLGGSGLCSPRPQGPSPKGVTGYISKHTPSQKGPRWELFSASPGMSPDNSGPTGDGQSGRWRLCGAEEGGGSRRDGPSGSQPPRQAPAPAGRQSAVAGRPAAAHGRLRASDQSVLGARGDASQPRQAQRQARGPSRWLLTLLSLLSLCTPVLTGTCDTATIGRLSGEGTGEARRSQVRCPGPHPRERLGVLGVLALPTPGHGQPLSPRPRAQLHSGGRPSTRDSATLARPGSIRGRRPGQGKRPARGPAAEKGSGDPMNLQAGSPADASSPQQPCGQHQHQHAVPRGRS